METPEIQQKATKPPGLLPKHAQTWTVVGIAALMLVVIALSGKNPPKRSEPRTPVSGIVDANTARIQEYRKRVDEEARRLALEQAQLAAKKRELTTGEPPAYRPPAPMTSAALREWAPPPSPEDGSLRAEKSKRDYESLFASNIALSLRKELSTGNDETPPRGTAVQTRATDEPPAAARSGTVEHAGEPGISDGKKYRLFEGTVIETVLTNRLDGTFSGPATCMVTTNVYSHDGQKLIIPKGSRLLGEVKSVDKTGQQRLALTFHRLIMPDGYSANLDQFRGLDQIGETGLRDKVNHHYAQIFGASIAIGAIAGLAQSNTRYGIDQSGLDAYRQGVATSFSQSSMHVLDRFLNVLPTFTIREGQRVKVLLASDLELPAYESHTLPIDL